MQKQWRLAERPERIPDRSHFDLVEVPIPTLEPDKAVVKTLYLGAEPVKRGHPSRNKLLA